MDKYRGKLKEVYDSEIIQDYLKGIETPFGYLGHGNRTDETDERINRLYTDEYFNKAFSKDVLPTWIISKTSRHFMDSCTNIRAFRNGIIDSVLETKKLLDLEIHIDELDELEQKKLAEELDKSLEKALAQIQNKETNNE